MTLSAWIHKQTVTEASKILGVSKSRVSHWYNLRAFPNSTIWKVILKQSNNKIDYGKSLQEYFDNN